MSPVAWVIVALIVVLVVALLVDRRARYRERTRVLAEAKRLHDARVKATKLVIDFEHTPVRGPSRDRQLSGKARRRARRS